MNRTTFKFFIVSLLFAALTSCGGGSSFSGGNVNSGTPATQPEISFCSTSTSYSPGVAVSGTAKFRRRGLNLQTSGGVLVSGTTGAVISTALPIKYAEIRVLSGGSVIQCGTTNALGELRGLDGTSPLFLPNGAGNFTIEVLSRSNYTFPSAGKPTSSTLSAAVKEDIYSNTVYKISGTYTSNGFGGGANSPLDLVAQASEFSSTKIEGGAFNIYNDWVTAFEYLTSTSNTGSLDVSCLNPRLDMFWKAGFNPYEYVESGTNTVLSFYLRADNDLFISGGQSGNVKMADTDHWDDAVILHEIGHHIENVCGKIDSPGGFHFAQYRIDARLAWSEGFGNFMGAHIIKNNMTKINPDLTSLPNSEWLFYHDTIGYLDGGSPSMNHQLILMRLNKPGDGTGPGQYHDIVDPASYPGESHFREASIARGLFKGTNACSSNCGGGVGFDKYWTALGTTTNAGMGYTPFSSSAKFFAKVFAANGNTFSPTMTTIMTTDESLHMVGSSSFTVTAASSSTGNISANAWPGYGIKLSTNSSCNQNVLQPRSTAKTYGYYSDQRYSNHFFTIRKADLPGVTEIRLVPDSSCSVDLDLVVLSSGYYYNEDCGSFNSSTGACTSFTKDTVTNSSVILRTLSTGNSESISLNSLGTGYYLLNVRGYSSNPTIIPNTTSCVYTLQNQNGAVLCPSTSY